MHKLFRSLLTILVIVATPVAATVDSHSDILKSPNDNRSYKAVTLENKLTVLLISDPGADKAAAAMDVNVGSSNDPIESPGLAHFLEHMLFLGTKKFPDPDEYQKFISDHGGSHNAFTSLDHTNYFFDINANHFADALDRFAEQFTSPLFNSEYVEREVNAVHSEFTTRIKDDGRRFFSALKETLTEKHPYRKFSAGNLETLKDTEETSLRDALLKFYNDHYSANQMRLVLLGKEPIPTLQSWAIDKFSKIPNHNLDHQEIQQPFFQPGFLPAQININSIMDKRSMMVAFPIPSSFNYKTSQPVSFLSNLIGHEGFGSLLSELKSRQLVDSLGAGGQFDNRHNAMLTISMNLTEKGLDQQTEILELLFAYIELIRNKGIQKTYFDEQSKMLKIGFDYQEKSEPIHLVSALANALQDTSPDRVLYESYDLSHYDKSLYLEFINHLRPENMLIAVSAKSIEGKQKSPWYETSYSLEKLPEATLQRLRSPKMVAALKLPEANIFIPENTQLLKLKTASKPELLSKKDGITIWYGANTDFGTPKANLFLTLRSPAPMQSAESLNLAELMVALLKDILNEFSYPAYLAGLKYELYNHTRGVTIKISGYNDKQSTLLNKILLTLRYGTFTSDRFELAKERLQRSLLNAKDKKPYEQTNAEAQRILLSPSWSEEERLNALTPLSVKNLEQFRDAFFEIMDTEILSTGNVTRASSLNIGQQVERTILSSAKRQHVERSKVTHLRGKNTWYKKIKVAHPDTGFIYYIQGKDRSIKERAMFLLFDQILSSEYYAKIRTDKQLGYIVFATNFNLLEVPGLAFIVQSPNTDGLTLHQETQQFLQEQLGQLTTLEAEQLKRFQAAVTTRLMKKDNTLYAKSNHFWREIDELNYDFDTRAKLAEQVQKYTPKTIQLFFQELISQKGNALLVYSENDEQINDHDDTESLLLDDISKAELEHF